MLKRNPKYIDRTAASYKLTLAAPFHFKGSSTPQLVGCMKYNHHSSYERVSHAEKRVSMGVLLKKISIFSYINNVEPTRF
jgi:hypothetical protein